MGLPPPLGHPLCDKDVLPVPHSWYRYLAPFSGSSCCAPSPDGGLEAQEGGIILQKKSFTLNEKHRLPLYAIRPLLFFLIFISFFLYYYLYIE
jgi:hypothetical protein